MSVGENVRKLRMAVGMTQQELADKLGVSGPMITQIERGTKLPSIILGKEIAAVFDVSIDDLLK